MEEKKKENRGGRREGAGRPDAGRSCTVTLRISPLSKAALDAQPNKSEYVDNLIKSQVK